MGEQRAVSYLIHGLLFGPVERPVFLDRVFFEEEPDLVARGQEVVVADMSIFFACFRGEFRLPTSVQTYAYGATRSPTWTDPRMRAQIKFSQ
jgi:hypothetical protein